MYTLLLTPRAAGVSPSRDQTAGSRAGTAWGQGHGADVAVQGGGLAQLDQHDVIVQIAAVVAGVADDLSRVDELLCAFIDGNVVFTETHLDAAAERRERQITCWQQPSGSLVSLHFETPWCRFEAGRFSKTQWVSVIQEAATLNQLWNQLKRHLRLVAVSSRHYPGAGDQGASTEVVARVQRDLVGHRVLSALVASNNLVILILNRSSIL